MAVGTKVGTFLNCSGLACWALCLACIVPFARADGTAKIHGNVTVCAGYKFPARRIPIVLLDNKGQTWTTRTDQDGNYSVVVPAPAVYSMSISHQSYCRVRRPSFDALSEDNLIFDFELLLCPNLESFTEKPAPAIAPYREEQVLTPEGNTLILAYGDRKDRGKEIHYEGIVDSANPDLRLPVTVRFKRYTLQGDSASFDRDQMRLTLEGKIFVANGGAREAYGEPCVNVWLGAPDPRPLPCHH